MEGGLLIIGIGLLGLGVVLLIIRWLGAWLLRIDDVIKELKLLRQDVRSLKSRE